MTVTERRSYQVAEIVHGVEGRISIENLAHGLETYPFRIHQAVEYWNREAHPLHGWKREIIVEGDHLRRPTREEARDALRLARQIDEWGGQGDDQGSGS